MLAALSDGLRIVRAEADTNVLFPANSRMLTRFLMDETYGASRPLSAAWMQRGVLDAAADSDFFSRLAYYDEARKNGTPQGAIFVATRDDGSICGFADVGSSLWLPNDRAFRLPQSEDLQRLARTGVGTDGQPKPGVELRPCTRCDSNSRRLGLAVLRDSFATARPRCSA